ncbi:MAG TPA: purine-nucleoside phosphorylase [Chloroflexia bacterium]|nr:purine-nucleoside phosphorylase [Chloroflexia bacterium]
MSDLSNKIDLAAGAIRARLPEGWIPQVAIILGSGLGALADQVDALVTMPYSEIPNFAVSTVPGHAGRLVCGTLEGTRVLVMQGRLHYYEGHSLQVTTFPVRVMKALGARILLVTNAAGGLNRTFDVGDLMLIEDHINVLGWGGQNPLTGPNDDKLGPRFPPMADSYDPDLLRLAEEASVACNVPVQKGVYIVLAGPTFETRAELRLLSQWGDAVGMSTVPEVIVARHGEGPGKMRVLGISNITNLALPDNKETANHEEVLREGQKSGPRFIKLIREIVKRIGSSWSRWEPEETSP